MRMAGTLLQALLVAITTTLCVSAAFAHELRPGYLDLRQMSDEAYALAWKKPIGGEIRFEIAPLVPEGCQLTGRTQQFVSVDAAVARGTLYCSGGLAGKTLRIAGLETVATDVLVRIQHRDGHVENHLLKPAQPFITFGAQTTWWQKSGTFLQLGVEHILLGVDHLLFVLGLLLIVTDRWTLVKTITSFTVAHSLTLAIATLGYAHAPAAPLNVAIALSILFLGPEIIRSRHGETSLTIRQPWLVAFAFGLLHGFGFASGLTAMGLPPAEIPWALLLFNVGVEIGQLLFVGLILLLLWAFRTLQIEWPRAISILAGYAVGSLGAYWTIQRTVMLLGGLR
jgi:HupE/UreJ protein